MTRPDRTRLDPTRLESLDPTRPYSTGLDPIRLDQTRLDSTRLESLEPTRPHSTGLDPTRSQSTGLDLTRLDPARPDSTGPTRSLNVLKMPYLASRPSTTNSRRQTTRNMQGCKKLSCRRGTARRLRQLKFCHLRHNCTKKTHLKRLHYVHDLDS